jgi:hypothetical protein
MDSASSTGNPTQSHHPLLPSSTHIPSILLHHPHHILHRSGDWRLGYGLSPRIRMGVRRGEGYTGLVEVLYLLCECLWR